MEPLDALEIAVALFRNALAQREAGAGQIEVHVYDDGVEVTDDGVGFPVHPHPKSGRPLITVILTGPRRGPLNTLARVTRSCLWVEATVFRADGVYRQRIDFAAPGPLEGPTPQAEGQPARGTAIRCAPAQGELPPLDALARQLEALMGEGQALLRDHRVHETRTLGSPHA